MLTHLVTVSMWGSEPSEASTSENEANGTRTPLQEATARSPRAHLFAYYPLLLQLAFVPSAPSMWVTPGEYLRLFGKGIDGQADDSLSRPVENGTSEEEDMVEVSARELARRALELVGEELCLGQ